MRYQAALHPDEFLSVLKKRRIIPEATAGGEEFSGVGLAF
jgi:hypothetical protein